MQTWPGALAGERKGRGTPDATVRKEVNVGQDETARYQGTIGRTREESTPWWPERPGAPSGAPNIVIIYMDDMGFSAPQGPSVHVCRRLPRIW